MKPSYYRISLDIHDATSQLSFSIKKGDTNRRLLISLSDNGVPYVLTGDCYATFTARKGNGKLVLNDCTIEKNSIMYDITEDASSTEGRLDCEITLFGINGEQITSPRFTMIVYNSVVSQVEDEVIDSGEYKALTELIAEGKELISDLEPKIEAVDDILNQDYIPVNKTPIQDNHVTNKKYVDDKFNGANKAISFENYEAMISWMNNMSFEESKTYEVGQNIMIVTLNVPDLWVSQKVDTRIEYYYSSDEEFINSLNSNEGVQVGYFILSALETQKVDLEDYYDKEVVDEKLAGKLDARTGSDTKGLVYGNSYDGRPMPSLKYAYDPGLATNGTLAIYFNKELTDYQKRQNPPGALLTCVPAYDYQAANKKYVDEGLVKKLDLQVDTGRKSVYVCDDTNSAKPAQQGLTGIAGHPIYASNGQIAQYLNPNTNYGSTMPTGILVSAMPNYDYHTANKKYVDDMWAKIYPVGSVYMSFNETSPEELFGGTWSKLENRFLFGSGGDYTSGSTGGSADAVVVEHNHGVKMVTNGTNGDYNAYPSLTSAGDEVLTNASGAMILNAGESGVNKNMPPYLVVNMWYRTA